MTAEYDSLAWQKIRNKKLAEWVQDPYAVDVILDLSELAEVWDDIVDGDNPINKDRVGRLFYRLVAELPFNPFFVKHKAQISPVFVTAMNAWQDANDMERGSDHDDKVRAFTLRFWCVEIIIYVIGLTRGYKVMRSLSAEVRRFFTGHESLDKYLEVLP
jgi:hypothetical protein